jgi:hypothetical protein
VSVPANPANCRTGPSLALGHLQRAYEEAQVQRLVRPAELRAALDRSPGCHGTPAPRALLADDRKPALIRSEAEARLLALLRAADLPRLTWRQIEAPPEAVIARLALALFRA